MLKNKKPPAGFESAGGLIAVKPNATHFESAWRLVLNTFCLTFKGY